MRSFVGPLTAALLLAACGSAGTTSTPGINGDGGTAAPTSSSGESGATSTSAAPATTVDEAPTTDASDPLATDVVATDPVAPTSTDAPAPPATDAPAPPATDAPAPPPTDPPAPPDPLTDPSKSWWFVGTEEGDPEAMSDGANCLGLYEAQAVGTPSYSRCGPWESFDGSYMWTVLKGASDRFQAVIWQQTDDPFTWIPKMKLVEPADDSGSVPSGWESVSIFTADVDSGPADELVAGVRLSGTGKFLYFDVIDVRGGNPEPVATIHELDRAIAFPQDDVGVFFHVPQIIDGEPNCCPSVWDQYLLALTDDGWRVAEGWAGFPIESITGTDAF